MSVERCAIRLKRHGSPPKRSLLLLGAIVLVASACGPKKPAIPEDVETLAHRCYETLATAERTPQLNPSEGMEDGTFLILWSIAESPDEQGSCIVDGSGAVLLLTSNADERPEETSTESPNSQN
ncbi:MAG: hypothetical protein AAGI69_29440 [Cyanobacteria bacterium P01_H01_bin.21]